MFQMPTNVPNVSNVQGVVPVIEVPNPNFDGDYLKFCQSYDLFTHMIHNQSLSKVQKMWYLKANYLVNLKKNYTDAWTLLQDRYNNKRVLACSRKF